jgi:hypothetical protein
VIEATLVSEIADNVAREAWVKRYTDTLSTPGIGEPQRDYASRFMRVINGLGNSVNMPGTLLSFIARKVDMAASIRD